MAEQVQTSASLAPRVKATFQLGSGVFSVDSKPGTLSQQLAAMKEESMNILKDYITSHNAPIDVPDEPTEEGASEKDEEEEEKKPPKKSKRKK